MTQATVARHKSDTGLALAEWRWGMGVRVSAMPLQHHGQLEQAALPGLAPCAHGGFCPPAVPAALPGLNLTS